MVTALESILTIDGASGAGKTRLLRALAARYPVGIVELGLVVRTVSWLSVRHRLSVPDAVAALARLGASGRVLIDCEGSGPLAASDVKLDGVPLGSRLFSPGLARATAATSLDTEAMAWIYGYVRATVDGRRVALTGRQVGRSLGWGAGLRIRLEADTQVRAQRKLAQLREIGSLGPFVDDALLLSPDDAGTVVIDTTHLDGDRVADHVFRLVERRIGWRPRSRPSRPADPAVRVLPMTCSANPQFELRADTPHRSRVVGAVVLTARLRSLHGHGTDLAPVARALDSARSAVGRTRS